VSRFVLAAALAGWPDDAEQRPLSLLRTHALEPARSGLPGGPGVRIGCRPVIGGTLKVPMAGRQDGAQHVLDSIPWGSLIHFSVLV